NAPVVVTLGQVNATPVGGVRSLGGTLIAGYNRGLGNDFPRVAWNRAEGRVDVAWNDGSLHPLGDIWVRAYTPDLGGSSVIGRANDASDFALHFLPALSVRSNGRICTSWYDRSRFGPDSAHTDYVGECRTSPRLPGADFTISSGATDWTNTSSRHLDGDVAPPVDEREQVERALGGADRLQENGEDLVAVEEHLEIIPLADGRARERLQRAKELR